MPAARSLGPNALRRADLLARVLGGRRAALSRRALSTWKQSAACLAGTGALLATLAPLEWLVMIALGFMDVALRVGLLLGDTATSPHPAARLCTVEELGLVCSSGRGERFLGAGVQGLFSGGAVRRSRSDCNFGRLDHDAARRPSPSGDSAACRGDGAVYDLVGHAKAWATLTAGPVFLGLVGSDYRYADLRLLTCGAHVLVPASFIDQLELGQSGSVVAVGGRGGLLPLTD